MYLYHLFQEDPALSSSFASSTSTNKNSTFDTAVKEFIQEGLEIEAVSTSLVSPDETPSVSMAPSVGCNSLSAKCAELDKSRDLSEKDDGCDKEVYAENFDKNNIDDSGDTYGKKNTWVTCVGQISALVNDFEHCKSILFKIKNEDVPNPLLYLMDAVQVITSIRDKSKQFVENATDVLTEMSNGNVIKSCDNASDNLVEHDPGKRSKISSGNQRNYLISLGPYQPKLTRFPENESIPKHKQTHFCANWYKEYPHIEYSIAKDAAFCFVCSLFPEGINRELADPAWIHLGVRQWHKMKSVGTKKQGKLAQHFSSTAHKSALGDYCHFITKSSHVDALLNKSVRAQAIQLEQERAFNTQAVHMLMDVARTLARQGLALRGDKNDEDGNFYQIVQLLSRHCYVMKRWLQDSSLRPYHVTYLGHKSQNEFIDLLASEVRRTIVEEIKVANVYAIMADTTPDISHQDRLAVSVRYVDDQGKPKERLLEVAEATDKTGLGLATKIVDILTRNELHVGNIVYQSYDYASCMSGQYHGTQKQLSELVGRNIPYIPCQAHRLNTFIEHSCNASVVIGDLFSVLESLYVFFSSSTKRYSHLMTELSAMENSLKLQNLSKTRWTARAESIKAVWASFECVINVLSEISISQKFDGKTKLGAHGLSKKLLTFDFIVALMFMKNIMYKLKNLTEKLEAEELNIIDATILIDSAIQSLESINCDSDGTDQLIGSAIAFAKTFDVDAVADFNRHHRKRMPSKRLDSHCSTQADFTLHSFYRKEFKMILNMLITLSRDNLGACINTVKPLFNILYPPMKREACTVEHVESAIRLFPPDGDIACVTDVLAAQAELEILSDQCKNTVSLTGVMEKSETLKGIIPVANRICRLAFTAPVTVASNERVFSKLKFVKTYLRSTMTDSRLDSLLILFSEKDIVDKIDVNKLISRWALLKQRRVKII